VGCLISQPGKHSVSYDLTRQTIEVRSRNNCYRGKALSITYSECVFVALYIRHEKRMRRIKLSPVACPAVPHFSALFDMIWYDMIYLFTAVGLSPGGSSTVHIYTQTVHRTIQNKQYIEQHNNFEECGPCPVLASYILAFALQRRKKHGKTSVRVAEECQLAKWSYINIQ
jgi:hypothetical protein